MPEVEASLDVQEVFIIKCTWTLLLFFPDFKMLICFDLETLVRRLHASEANAACFHVCVLLKRSLPTNS